MSNIIPLIICHKCGNRVEKGRSYTNYKNSIYCDPCFVEHLEDIDLTSYMEHNTVIEESK